MSQPFENWIDRQIREATERGEFDNLPGSGKPLTNLAKSDENWWIKQKLEREGIDLSTAMPESLRLRKEIAEIDQRLAGLRTEQLVRDHVAALNDQVRRSHRQRIDGPPVVLRILDADAVVARWRDGRSGS